MVTPPMTHSTQYYGPLHVLITSPLLGGDVPNLDGVPHSCEPNSWGGVFDDNMVVLSLQSLTPHEPLTMSTLWSPCEMPIQYRHLRLGYKCDCTRCVRETETEAPSTASMTAINLQDLGVDPSWVRNPNHMNLFLRIVQMDVIEPSLSTRDRIDAAVAGYSLRDIRPNVYSQVMLHFLISESIVLLCTTICCRSNTFTEEEAGIAVAIFHHAFKYDLIASRSLGFKCAACESAQILLNACLNMQLAKTTVFANLCDMSKVLLG